MRRINLLTALSLVVLPMVVLLLSCNSCVSKTAVDTGQGTETRSNSLVAVISDIEAYEPPVGVTGFEDLRQGLLRAISATGKDRITAAPPRGNANVVSDLLINDANATLSWTYVNTGDYDQNSEVNVGDLTPIAIHFGKNTGSSDWDEAQVADGDRNGEVNAADITPIAVSYLNQVNSYNIYTSASLDDYPAAPDDPNGGNAVVAGSIAFDEAETPTGFKTFTALISAPVDENFYWVRPSDGEAIGAASNSVQHDAPINPNQAPTAMVDATPTTGESPLTVDFDASGSTDIDGTIDLYEWDWNGAVDGFFWESTGTTATAQHVYSVVGIHNPVVRVTDNLGATNTATVQIEVTPPIVTGFTISGRVQNAITLPPVAIPDVEVHIEAFDGSGFTASGFSDFDGMFEIPNIPAGGDYYVYCDDPAWIWPPSYQEIIDMDQDEFKWLNVIAKAD